MGSNRLHLAILAALCIAIFGSVLCKAVDAQLTSQWISESDSYTQGGESLDLDIEPEADQACDGSMGQCGLVDEEGGADLGHGRQLARMRIYWSYASLSADRVPCRPLSGRSYYTNDCWGASGAVNPYSRACTVVTRCYRWTS